MLCCTIRAPIKRAYKQCVCVLPHFLAMADCPPPYDFDAETYETTVRFIGEFNHPETGNRRFSKTASVRVQLRINREDIDRKDGIKGRVFGWRATKAYGQRDPSVDWRRTEFVTPSLIDPAVREFIAFKALWQFRVYVLGMAMLPILDSMDPNVARECIDHPNWHYNEFYSLKHYTKSPHNKRGVRGGKGKEARKRRHDAAVMRALDSAQL